ncbi:MAG: hypothetical protein ACR2HX_20465 [Pyrinomonadaceae bacterium]
MSLEIREQQTIRQYLLGLAPQEDSSRLEEQLLTNGALYGELLISEDELIDEYLSGELSQLDRRSFETHFLTAPERRQKLRFAQALRKYLTVAGAPDSQEVVAAEKSFEEASAVTRTASGRKWSVTSLFPTWNPIVSYSLAAAMLLFTGGISWVVLNNWRQQEARQAGNILTVSLTPGLVRDGGETKRISILPSTGGVRLRLILNTDATQIYRAELLDGERLSLVVQDNLKPETEGGEKFVTLDLPAKILKRGDYQVKLGRQLSDGSIEDTGRYSFRVVN